MRAIVDAVGKRYLRKEVALDDIVDALVAALTAKYGHGNLKTLPEVPQIDSHGIAMEMVIDEI